MKTLSQKIIYKSILTPGHNTILVPIGSELLSVKNQSGNISVWYLCELSNAHERLQLYVGVTGSYLPDLSIHGELNFIDTVLLDNDTFVVHVFEIKKTNKD